MKLPELIRVGAVDVEVRSVDRAEATRSGFLGRFDADADLIEVAAHLRPRKAAVVLIHEVLHAAAYASGLGLPDEQEERIVDALAGPLASALIDSPGFAEALISARGRKR